MLKRCLNFAKLKLKIQSLFTLVKKPWLMFKMLSDCFSRAKTIPGTRPFHQFITLLSMKIALKRVSNDISYSLKFEFEQVQQVLSLSMVSIGQFVLCFYDAQCTLGYQPLPQVIHPYILFFYEIFSVKSCDIRIFHLNPILSFKSN